MRALSNWEHVMSASIEYGRKVFKDNQIYIFWHTNGLILIVSTLIGYHYHSLFGKIGAQREKWPARFSQHFDQSDCMPWPAFPLPAPLLAWIQQSRPCIWCYQLRAWKRGWAINSCCVNLSPWFGWSTNSSILASRLGKYKNMIGTSNSDLSPFSTYLLHTLCNISHIPDLLQWQCCFLAAKKLFPVYKKSERYNYIYTYYYQQKRLCYFLYAVACRNMWRDIAEPPCRRNWELSSIIYLRTRIQKPVLKTVLDS